jgi:hypothetical protein
MSEHNDLDRQLFVAPPKEQEQLKHTDKGQVEEKQRHGPASSFAADLRKSYSDRPDEILGTHRFLAPTG